jgi:hypothetical protein
MVCTCGMRLPSRYTTGTCSSRGCSFRLRVYWALCQWHWQLWVLRSTLTFKTTDTPLVSVEGISTVITPPTRDDNRGDSMCHWHTSTLARSAARM